MLRMLVRSLSLVAILAGTAAAAGDPLPEEAPAKVETKTTKTVKKKSVRKAKKKAARKSLKKKSKRSKKSKRAAKAAKLEAPAERRPVP